MAGKSLVSQFKSAGNFIAVPLAQIHVRPNFNPRTIFDREEMDELKKSISSNGFLPSKPLEIYEEKGLWILGDGERRYRAAVELEKEGISFPHGVPCIVVRKKNDLERLTEALIANEHRAPLQPLDEARAFVRLQNFGWKPGDIAARLGKSEVFIYNRLALIEAETSLVEEIKAGEISLNDAIKIIKASRASDLSQAELRAKQKAEAAKRKAEAKAAREAARNGAPATVAVPVEEAKPTPATVAGPAVPVAVPSSTATIAVPATPAVPTATVAVPTEEAKPTPATVVVPSGHKPSDLDDSFESELLRLGVSADDYTNPVVRIGAELSSIVSADPGENLAIIVRWLADYCGSALAFKLYVDSVLTSPTVPADGKPVVVKAAPEKPVLHVPTSLLPAGSARAELASLAAAAVKEEIKDMIASTPAVEEVSIPAVPATVPKGKRSKK